jgi:hypothetical protein
LELEEIKEIEIPRFPVNKLEIRELAVMVLSESERLSGLSKELIRRFVERRYTYEPL